MKAYGTSDSTHFLLATVRCTMKENSCILWNIDDDKISSPLPTYVKIARWTFFETWRPQALQWERGCLEFDVDATRFTPEPWFTLVSMPVFKCEVSQPRVSMENSTRQCTAYGVTQTDCYSGFGFLQSRGVVHCSQDKCYPRIPHCMDSSPCFSHRKPTVDSVWAGQANWGLAARKRRCRLMQIITPKIHQLVV